VIFKNPFLQTSQINPVLSELGTQESHPTILQILHYLEFPDTNSTYPV